MKKAVVCGAIAVALTLSMSAQAAVEFSFSLDESQAGVNTGLNHSGSGTVTLNDDADAISVVITHDIPAGDVTAGHIHLGGIGENGDVVFPFSDATSPVSESFPISIDQVQTLFAGDYYVNIHTTANPTGEIRGQIINPNGPSPVPASSAWTLAALALLLMVVAGGVMVLKRGRV